jgi:membrane protease YdiL (CAAX protease family)
MFIKSKSFLYIILTLGLSWILTFVLFQHPNQAEQSFAIVMFIPMIMAFIFQRIPSLRRKEKIPFVSNRLPGKSIAFAIIYPLIIVAVITIIDIILRIGHTNKESIGDIHAFVSTFILLIPALLSAFGEEFGWRGYLLPTLNETFSKLQSSVITGIVWMLFHVPVVFLLARLEGLSNPIMVTVVQAADVFFFSYAFAFLFFGSKHILPVCILHAVWNVYNPYVLGDIYTDKPGILRGNLFVLNGEGLMGLLIAAIFSVYFLYRLKSNSDSNEDTGRRVNNLQKAK